VVTVIPNLTAYWRQFNRYLLVSRLSLTVYSDRRFTYVQQSFLFLFTIAHVRHLWPGTGTYRSFRVCTIALIPARIHAVRLYLQKPCISRPFVREGLCGRGQAAPTRWKKNTLKYTGSPGEWIRGSQTRPFDNVALYIVNNRCPTCAPEVLFSASSTYGHLGYTSECYTFRAASSLRTHLFAPRKYFMAIKRTLCGWQHILWWNDRELRFKHIKFNTFNNSYVELRRTRDYISQLEKIYFIILKNIYILYIPIYLNRDFTFQYILKDFKLHETPHEI